jgi:hypothetical protein
MEGGDDASDVRFGRITLNGEGEAGTFKIGKLGLGWANKEKQLAIKAADIKYAKWVHIAKFYQLAVSERRNLKTTSLRFFFFFFFFFFCGKRSCGLSDEFGCKRLRV